MAQSNWIPITEYAGKHGVSISTLRRRIKSGQIQFNFQDGKYLLVDHPVKTSTPAAASVAPPTKHTQARVESFEKPKPETRSDEESSPVLATANRLLNELKKAYALILQEKEAQILQLREELTDLRTLVRVLESENQRLNQQKADLNWLD